MAQKKSKIEQLWHIVENYGYLVRFNNINGRFAWNDINNIFPDVTFNWTEKSKQHYTMLKRLGVRGDDNDPLDDLWEPYHFLLQHGRIVHKNNGSLMRLMQIAYNCGQYKNCAERLNIYTSQMRELFISGKYEHIDTYIDLYTKECFEAILTKKYLINIDRHLSHYIKNEICKINVNFICEKATSMQ